MAKAAKRKTKDSSRKALITDWLATAKTPSSGCLSAQAGGQIVVCSQKSEAALYKAMSAQINTWQLERLKSSTESCLLLEGEAGPWLIVRPHLFEDGPAEIKRREPELLASAYSLARDMVGAGFRRLNAYKLKDLGVHFVGVSSEEVVGSLVGMQMSAYKFRTASKGPSSRPHLQLYKLRGRVSAAELSRAHSMSVGVNIARHLVNLPPNKLGPKTYPELVLQSLSGLKGISVEVWNEARLKKENMGLLLGVGQGSEQPPCLIHIKYRPRGTAKSQKPLAIIGKGITFDTGGLDIKPSQFMRLMKKDMGGSAAVVGLAYYVAAQQVKKKCDFYLAIAENSVSRKSFRPGDVLISRSGKEVEIDNTDAEGRLALADAMDVAIDPPGGELPRAIIDVATLTGACKVGLGSGVAGLFSNDAKLKAKVMTCAQERGDPFWPLPLVQAYRSRMKSPVADFASATSGYGGAITAALFLESFVGDKPWAHMDIFAWADSAKGALSEVGGSGQAVQALAKLVESY